MKILIGEIEPNEVPRLLVKLHQVSRPQIHELVDDPSLADLIIVCGSWTMEGKIPLLTKHPYVLRFPEKTIAYSDDDAYLPLIPGVYCSPEKGFSTRVGRVLTYSYIVRHVQKGNPFVRDFYESRPKDLLFSFKGASTSMVRKKLFRTRFDRSDVLIEDTYSHRTWIPGSDTSARQKVYVETILRSHFVLCPRGGGTGSFRFFEVMRMGVAPVLLADSYVLPKGPYWDSFLIRVPESRIRDLPKILEGHRSESLERGKRARAAWEQWFDTTHEFNRIVALCQEAQKASQPVEHLYRTLWPAMISKHYAQRFLRRNIRSLALGLLRMTKLQSPYNIRGDDPNPFDPRSARDDIATG